MSSKTQDPGIVAFSVKSYQLLLVAYPIKFQQEYGLQMVQVFRDYCLRTIRQSGNHGMLKLWMITLLDLIQSVISEHSQKETAMKQEMKPEDIQRAGWALILGAISLVIGIFSIVLKDSNWSMFVVLLVFVSLPLLVFGILGLRARYGKKVGSFGKNILLVGAILGPVTSILGFFLMAIYPLWFITFMGPAILFVCLTLFGVAALYTKPMPRWNSLPILAGLSYPASMFFYIITSLLTEDWSGSSIPDIVNILLIVMQSIALVVLGYILKADASEEIAVLA